MLFELAPINLWALEIISDQNNYVSRAKTKITDRIICITKRMHRGLLFLSTFSKDTEFENLINIKILTTFEII